MAYKVNFGPLFTSEKTEYEPGEPVKVIFPFIATDTSYRFHVNADDKKEEYKNGVIEITFTMPDHDVEVDVNSKNTMEPEPNPMLTPVGAFTGMGFGMFAPGMFNPPSGNTPAPSTGTTPDTEVSQPSNTPEGEWICPECSTKNTGRFCTNCAKPRPV